jgi:hypothetical protein
MISDRLFPRRKMTAAEREARKVFRTEEPKGALTEYAKARKAFDENRERLKAERLARESNTAVATSGKHIR